jgi:hypothetical protein
MKTLILAALAFGAMTMTFPIAPAHALICTKIGNSTFCN